MKPRTFVGLLARRIGTVDLADAKNMKKIIKLVYLSMRQKSGWTTNSNVHTRLLGGKESCFLTARDFEVFLEQVRVAVSHTEKEGVLVCIHLVEKCSDGSLPDGRDAREMLLSLSANRPLPSILCTNLAGSAFFDSKAVQV